jgi:hypothetical protein
MFASCLPRLGLVENKMIRVDFKRPIQFKNGLASGIEFQRLSIDNVLSMAGKGDFLSPEVASEFAVKYGKGINGDERFGIVEEDITESLSSVPALACTQAIEQASSFNRDLEDGELVDPDPIYSGGESSIRLKHPIKIEWGIDGKNEIIEIDWLTFKAQKYKDAAAFVRADLYSEIRKVPIFIRAFGTMMNLPDGYPANLGITEAHCGSMDLSDAERIAALIMPNFIEEPLASVKA